MKKSLKKKSMLEKKFEETMRDYINNGYARKLSNEEGGKVNNRVEFGAYSIIQFLIRTNQT